MPYVRAYHDTSQAVEASSLWSALSFNSEAFSSGGLHSTATNNSRITFASSGYYIVSAGTEWSLSADSYRHLGIRKNGSSVIVASGRWTNPTGSTANPSLTVTTMDLFDSGDYVEAVVRHEAATSQFVLYSSKYSPFFAAVQAPTTKAIRLTHSAAQTISTGNSYTGLNFDTEIFDTIGAHSTAAATSEINLGLSTGIWLMGASCEWQRAAITTGTYMHLALREEGFAIADDGLFAGEVHVGQQGAGQNTLFMTAQSGEAMASTFMMTVRARQNATPGSTLDILATLSYSPIFWAVKMEPL